MKGKHLKKRQSSFKKLARHNNALSKAISVFIVLAFILGIAPTGALPTLSAAPPPDIYVPAVLTDNTAINSGSLMLRITYAKETIGAGEKIIVELAPQTSGLVKIAAFENDIPIMGYIAGERVEVGRLYITYRNGVSPNTDEICVFTVIFNDAFERAHDEIGLYNITGYFYLLADIEYKDTVTDGHHIDAAVFEGTPVEIPIPPGSPDDPPKDDFYPGERLAKDWRYGNKNGIGDYQDTIVNGDYNNLDTMRWYLSMGFLNLTNRNLRASSRAGDSLLRHYTTGTALAYSNDNPTDDRYETANEPYLRYPPDVLLVDEPFHYNDVTLDDYLDVYDGLNLLSAHEYIEDSIRIVRVVGRADTPKDVFKYIADYNFLKTASANIDQIYRFAGQSPFPGRRGLTIQEFFTQMKSEGQFAAYSNWQEIITFNWVPSSGNPSVSIPHFRLKLGDLHFSDAYTGSVTGLALNSSGTQLDNYWNVSVPAKNLPFAYLVYYDSRATGIELDSHNLFHFFNKAEFSYDDVVYSAQSESLALRDLGSDASGIIPGILRIMKVDKDNVVIPGTTFTLTRLGGTYTPQVIITPGGGIVTFIIRNPGSYTLTETLPTGSKLVPMAPLTFNVTQAMIDSRVINLASVLPDGYSSASDISFNATTNTNIVANMPKSYDVALRKWVSEIKRGSEVVQGPIPDPGNSATPPLKVKIGDKVTFTIKLFNQTENDTWVTKLHDYVPAGYTFSATDNPNWEIVTVGGVTFYNYTGDPIFLAGNPNYAADGTYVLGSTDVVTIVLTVAPAAVNGVNLVNWAEVKEIMDDKDGEPDEVVEDRDSHNPDDEMSDPENEKDNETDEIWNDGENDKDDLDFAEVKIIEYDVALRKWVSAVNGGSTATDVQNSISTAESGSLSPIVRVMKGDKVTFTIKLFNQTDNDTWVTKLHDYIPAGYAFSSTDNPDWELITGSGSQAIRYTGGPIFLAGNPGYELDGSYANGSTATFEIILTVSPEAENGVNLRNWAEVREIRENVVGTGGQDDAPGGVVEDRDSHNPGPGDGMSAAGNEKDNEIDEIWGPNGSNDKDDLDYAEVAYGVYDAALRKWVSEVERNGLTVTGPISDPGNNPSQPARVKKGDQVKFAIKLINQCEETVILNPISDYIPEGYDFDSTDPRNVGWVNTGKYWDSSAQAWTLTAIPGALRLLQYEEDIRLLPGEEQTIYVVLTVNAAATIDNLLNVAEISGMTDEDGNPVPDIDSDPDDNPENDGEIKDNEVDEGGGDDDEDDHDSADLELYASTPVTVPLAGAKTLTDSHGAALLFTAGQFTFTMTPDSTNPVDGCAWSLSGSTSIPVAGDGVIDLGALTFTEEGVYRFTVTEIDGGVTNYYYDRFSVVVTYVITDINDALVVANTTYVKGGLPVDSVYFDNTYEEPPQHDPEPGTVTIRGIKTLTDADTLADLPITLGLFEFIFTEGQTDGQDWDGINPIAAVANGTIDFGKLTFTRPGLYTYTISEVTPDPLPPGYTFDQRVVTLSVLVEEIDGELVASVSYEKAGSTADGIFFNNTYKRERVVNGVPVAISAVKTANEAMAANQFTFTLYWSDSSGTPGAVARTATNASAGLSSQVVFADIQFSAPGTYYLLMRETAGGTSNWSVDTSRYLIEILIEDDGDSPDLIVANIQYSKLDGIVWVSYDGTPAFVNTYTSGGGGGRVVGGVLVPVSAIKTANAAMTANQFSFTLYWSDGSGTQGAATRTATNASAGMSSQVVFADIQFNSPGTYYLLMRETSGGTSRWSVDASRYLIEVIIEDDGVSSELIVVSIRYFKWGGGAWTPYVGTPAFANTYTPGDDGGKKDDKIDDDDDDDDDKKDDDKKDDGKKDDEGGGPPPPNPTIPGHTLVKQEDGTYIEYDGVGVPKGVWHWDDVEEEWIFDEFPPPLAALPGTMVNGIPTRLLLLLCVALLVINLASRKKANKRGALRRNS